MKKIMDSYQFKTWLSFLLLAVVVIVIFHAVAEAATFFEWLGFLFFTVAPFVWGFMIAYALNIPREGLEKLLLRLNHPFVRRRVRGFSVLLTYIAFIVVVSMLSVLVFPQIYESIVSFGRFLPELIDIVGELLIELDEGIPFFELSAVVEGFNDEEILSIFNVDNMTAAFNTLMSFVGSVFRAAIALISSVYFLLETERIKGFAARIFRAIMSQKFYTVFMKYSRDINTYFKRYIFCQVLDAMILGTIMTFALSVLGVNYAFALGPMLGFANLIPYFGSIVGTIAAIVVIMITDGPQLGLIAAVVMLIIQQFDANFIFPRLLGGQMKIPPLLVIIGITVGGAYYGILGMIMAIPIATVARNVIDDILRNIEARKQGRAPGEERRVGERRRN
ncbi:MAG: AI-2E family transporter [Clostridiales bacterium]|jgi:predicted PurR-regulated permease PerM|nr:AI-2E family transporter [Clostridiales bacterium]